MPDLMEQEVVKLDRDRDREEVTAGNRRTTRDESYRSILGEEAWCRLAPEIRGRFSAKPRHGKSIRYEGSMHTVELSWMGWLFAQACRLIGTPLALHRGRNVPMMIDLVRDDRLKGVAWHRTYKFPGRTLFTVRSTKCQGSNGEFIEHIGCGFLMRLKLTEENGGLVFRSVSYEIDIRGRRLRIPALLTPGVTTVTHEQLAGERFRFSLSVEHPLLGRTIYQEGEFYSSVSDR